MSDQQQETRSPEDAAEASREVETVETDPTSAGDELQAGDDGSTEAAPVETVEAAEAAIEEEPAVEAEADEATVEAASDEGPEAEAAGTEEVSAEAVTPEEPAADAESAEAENEVETVEADDEVAPAPPAESSEESSGESAESGATDDAVAAATEAESADAETSAEGATAEKPKPKKKRKRKPKKGAPTPPAEESEELKALRRARDEKIALQGRVFGWNDGGFHIAIGEIPAFCPRSEIAAKPSIGDPAAYVDQVLPFRVLKIQGGGKRIVVSHAVLVREFQAERRKETMQTLEVGATVSGKISSLADFGAFVDLGGIEGLVHISEISRQRVEKPADVLEMGQEVEVKILKIEKGGKRISLSIKALQPDPWRDIKERYEEGSIVTGRVERTGRPGAFIELEPGLTGLLPTSEMSLPRDAIAARLYPPGKEVKVMVAQVDVRRRRIALVPEGAAVGGSRADYVRYQKEQKTEGDGFNAMAAALSKFKK